MGAIRAVVDMTDEFKAWLAHVYLMKMLEREQSRLIANYLLDVLILSGLFFVLDGWWLVVNAAVLVFFITRLVHVFQRFQKTQDWITSNGVEGAGMKPGLHKPMLDCGHCWAYRNDIPDLDPSGHWEIEICEECDKRWPCPDSSC